MSVDLIKMWHERARPSPTHANFNVQLGCHLEEIAEMLDATSIYSVMEDGEDGGAIDHSLWLAVKTFAEGLKSGSLNALVLDRTNFLDGIADQIVTGVGVAHCAKMDIAEALRRVNVSNWSKYDFDGQPLFDENGKISKGPNYVKPDLKGLC